jgi:hypothetical protein
MKMLKLVAFASGSAGGAGTICAAAEAGRNASTAAAIAARIE